MNLWADTPAARRVNVTILLEEGLQVLAATLVQNQPDQWKSFRCIRGLAAGARR